MVGWKELTHKLPIHLGFTKHGVVFYPWESPLPAEDTGCRRAMIPRAFTFPTTP